MEPVQKRTPSQWRVQIRKKGHPTQTRTFDAYAWHVEGEMDRGLFVSPEGRQKYDTFRGPRPVQVESLDEKTLYSLGRMEALCIDAEIFDEWEKGVVTVEDYDRILWKEEESNENKAPKNLMTWESFGQRLEQWGIFQSDVLETFPIAKNPPDE